jgi:predicted TIM-barrel fold metal-dependent hydrolase
MPHAADPVLRAPDSLEMNMSRRSFLQTTASTTLAAAGLASQHAESLAAASNDRDSNDREIPIVDTHVHLWDLKKFTLPWNQNDPLLTRDYLLADYLLAAKGLNITGAVYMEVDVVPEQHVAEAEWASALCEEKGSPFLGAIIGGRPASPEFKAYTRRFRDHKYVRGVRQVLHSASTPPGTCTTPEFIRGVRWLGEANLTFDFCMRSSDLGDCVQLVDACPDTRFVLDHCGNMSLVETDPAKRKAWYDGIAALAQRPNVMCKISGILFTAPKNWTENDLAPVVNDCLKQFGFERVLFASDWPVCLKGGTLAQWTNAVKALVKDQPIEKQLALFHDNAIRYYQFAGLESKPK